MSENVQRSNQTDDDMARRRQPMQLELVVEANAPVVAQKKEDGASCCHFAAIGWHHLPIELQSVVVSLNVAREPEDKTSCLHKLFVRGFDPLFQSFVPTNLA